MTRRCFIPDHLKVYYVGIGEAMQNVIQGRYVYVSCYNNAKTLRDSLEDLGIKVVFVIDKYSEEVFAVIDSVVSEG